MRYRALFLLATLAVPNVAAAADGPTSGNALGPVAAPVAVSSARPGASSVAAAKPTPELSMQAFQHFVNANAAMAGAVSACSTQEELLINLCGELIMEHWSQLTNYPSVDTPAFRKATRIAWSKQENHSRAMELSDSAVPCDRLMQSEAAAGMWKICTHPAVGSPLDPQNETPSSIKMQ